MGEHDGRYRFFFSYPRMVRDLLLGFLHEGWVGQLDFSTLERVSGSFVDKDRRQRHNDVLWRVRLDQEEGEWLYVYLVLELQSTPDRFMPVRMLGYIVRLLEDLIRRKELTPEGLLPPVLALVCYRGIEKWRPPLQLQELFAPVPADLRQHLPSLTYSLFDANRMRPQELRQPANLAASVFRIEAVRSPADLPPIAAALMDLLPPGEEPELRESLRDFLMEALQRALPGVIIPEIGDLEEISMLEHNMDLWRERTQREAKEQGFREGIQKGREEGVQKGLLKGREEALRGMRRVVLDLLVQRFGKVPQTVRRQLAGISSIEELGSLTKRALTAETLVDLRLG